MKKIYFLLLAFISIGIGASAQCVINTNDTAFGITPTDTFAPPIVQGKLFDTVAQVYIPDTIHAGGTTIEVAWVYISSVTNFPTGITHSQLPATDTIYGGGHACININGTTTDTVGVYILNFVGSIRILNAPLLGDTTLTFQELAALGALLGGKLPSIGYFLTVVSPSGIYDFNHQLQSAMQVIPNPNNGQFDIKLNYNGELTGDIKVLDATGRVVYNQPVNSNGFYTNTINLGNMAKGIYAVQLTTPDGVASKLVSVE